MSIGWKHFEVLPLGDTKKERAKCLKYGTVYLSEGKYGIGNVQCHLNSCVRRHTHDVS